MPTIVVSPHMGRALALGLAVALAVGLTAQTGKKPKSREEVARIRYDELLRRVDSFHMMIKAALDDLTDTTDVIQLHRTKNGGVAKRVLSPGVFGMIRAMPVFFRHGKRTFGIYEGTAATLVGAGGRKITKSNLRAIDLWYVARSTMPKSFGPKQRLSEQEVKRIEKVRIQVEKAGAESRRKSEELARKYWDRLITCKDSAKVSTAEATYDFRPVRAKKPCLRCHPEISEHEPIGYFLYQLPTFDKYLETTIPSTKKRKKG